MGKNNQEPRRKYLLGYSLTRFACFTRALSCAHSFSRSICSLPHSWDSERLNGYFLCVFYLFWTIVKCSYSRVYPSIPIYSLKGPGPPSIHATLLRHQGICQLGWQRFVPLRGEQRAVWPAQSHHRLQRGTEGSGRRDQWQR